MVGGVREGAFLGMKVDPGVIGYAESEFLDAGSVSLNPTPVCGIITCKIVGNCVFLDKCNK